MGLVKQCVAPQRVEMSRDFIEQKDRLRQALRGRQTRPLTQDNVQQKRLLLTRRAIGSGAIFLTVQDCQIHAVRPEKRPPGGTIPKGVYNVRICPFEGIAFLPPQNYAGTITSSDESGGSTSAIPLPAWRYFPANPTLRYDADHTPKNSVIGCWKLRGRDDCTLSSGPLDQLGMETWDYSFQTDSPTLGMA